MIVFFLTFKYIHVHELSTFGHITAMNVNAFHWDFMPLEETQNAASVMAIKWRNVEKLKGQEYLRKPPYKSTLTEALLKRR